MNSQKAVENIFLLFKLYFVQGAKKVSFITACCLPQLLFFYEWDWLQFFCNLNSLKKLYLPARQVKNTTQRTNHKIQYPRAIAWTLLSLFSLYAVYCNLART